uniref:Integrase catalytic domain-containing protein n=1 Tax=Tanacetum cinerariifolium TaxID=118510 RepID=A0A699HNB4_TANCI|nr:hypothetical protein [Tanacetum cinerariifolium]
MLMLVVEIEVGDMTANDIDNVSCSTDVVKSRQVDLILLDTPEACQDLVDHAAPPGYFTELRHMPNEEFLRQYNVNLARQVAIGSQLRLRFEQEAKLLKKSVAQVARRDKRIQARELEIKNLKVLLETEAETKRAAEVKNVELMRELEDVRAQFSDLKVKENQEKDKIRSKPDKKQEACQSREKFKAFAVDKGRKTKENAKRMVENAYTMGVKNLRSRVDSRLVANQVNGSYVAKEPGMIQYLEKVRAFTSTFKEFSIKQVPRGENEKADALRKIASTTFAHLSKQVLAEELKEKSIDEKEVFGSSGKRKTHILIYEYLAKGILLDEKKKARAIRRKTRRYALTNEVIYKRSFFGPWLHCVGPLQANYILKEIHEGSCSLHVGPRSVVVKALRSGYYWPTIHMDAKKLIRECNDCQFRDNPFKDWCEKICIRQCFASVKHPQAKGLVERENRSLDEGIKAQLDERSKHLIEEISHVLWADQTMIKSTNGETPFSLTYATEVVIPVEIGMPTWRTAKVDMIKNDEALGINLDLLEEKREQAAIQKAKCKAKMEKYYNARARNTSFKQATSSTEAMRQAMRKMKGSLDLSGKDRMRLQKH